MEILKQKIIAFAAKALEYDEDDIDLDEDIQELGFDHTSLDCVPMFQQGHRTSEALLEHLAVIYNRLAPELDR